MPVLMRLLNLPRPLKVFIVAFFSSATYLVLRWFYEIIRNREGQDIDLNCVALWAMVSLCLWVMLYPLNAPRRTRVFMAGSLGHLLLWGLFSGFAYQNGIHGYVGYNPDSWAKLMAAALPGVMFGLCFDLDRVGADDWPHFWQAAVFSLGFGPLLAGIMPSSYITSLLLPVLALGLVSGSMARTQWGFSLPIKQMAAAFMGLNFLAFMEAWHGHRITPEISWLLPALRMAVLSLALAPRPKASSLPWLAVLLGLALALSAGFGLKYLPENHALRSWAPVLAPLGMALGWALARPSLRSLVLGAVFILILWPLSLWVPKLAWCFDNIWLRDGLLMPGLFALYVIHAPMKALEWPIEKSENP
jgi:hypothetical protein